MSGASVAGARNGWRTAELQRLLAALNPRVAKRRALRAERCATRCSARPVADVDIATTTLPDETVRRAEAAGFKTVPTGVEHGTMTVIAAGKAL